MAAKKNAAYPDDNPKTIFGLTKPNIFLFPPVALLHGSRAFMDGAKKYGPYNWREKTVSMSIYLAAGMRHKLSFLDGEEVDPVSLVHHLGHDMACNAIILDAVANSKINDDRPPPGQFAPMVRLLTEQMEEMKAADERAARKSSRRRA